MFRGLIYLTRSQLHIVAVVPGDCFHKYYLRPRVIPSIQVSKLSAKYSNKENERIVAET